MRRISLQVRELIIVCVLSAVPYLFWAGQANALTLASRSVSISTATPSAVASHDFRMKLVSSGSIGSIQFEYCANTPLFSDPCLAPPPGLSLGGASLAQQSGNIGFSIDSADSTATKMIISRTAVPALNVPSEYLFAHIINPSVNNQTTFIRITTYASSDASGAYIDNGSVAFSTSTNFNVGAFVPPFLNFCAGVTVASDCSQSQGDSLDLGILSPQATRTATSQYAVSTNDVIGCSVYVLGSTMTSGNNIITELDTPSSSKSGTDQFGINLRQNNNPSTGNNPTGIGSSTASSAYGSPNLFSFVPGSQLSSSSQPTEYNRMTVTYIANVSTSQPPGVYATTLTYLASAQF